MARKHKTTQESGHVVLLIDDNPEYLRSTERILRRAGHRVLTAEGGPQGLEIVKSEPVEVILVDFLMPVMNGEEFVRELRTFNKKVQVILQTGYAQELPPAAMLKKLDIQGYHEKSDGPYKLLLWTDVGLQAAQTVRRLEQVRAGLTRILEVSREGEPLDELMQGILQQATALLGQGDSCLVTDEKGELMVAAGLGRFQQGQRVAELLDEETVQLVRSALAGRNPISSEGCYVLPLDASDLSLAIVHLDHLTNDSIDLQILQLFAHHASIAIHNAKLHDGVAVDGATGAYTRRFFEHALLRELRISHRSRQPLSVLRVGYRAEDPPLAISELIRRSTRATDVLGRYGEREFCVVLPNTDAAGAGVVAERIASGLVEANVGAAALSPPPENAQMSVPEQYFRSVAHTMIGQAEETVHNEAFQAVALSLDWPPLP